MKIKQKKNNIRLPKIKAMFGRGITRNENSPLELFTMNDERKITICAPIEIQMAPKHHRISSNIKNAKMIPAKTRILPPIKKKSTLTKQNDPNKPIKVKSRNPLTGRQSSKKLNLSKIMKKHYSSKE